MRAISAMRSALPTAALSILAVVLVIVLGARLDRAVRSEVVSRFEERQLLLVEQAAANVQHILDHATRDLAYLAAPDGPLHLRDLEKAEREPEIAAWQARAAHDLLLFLHHHPTYYAQIRYIDAEGQEIVGVDQDGQTMRVIPPDQLHSQAQRDFFLETMALDAGEVYVSRPRVALGHGGVGAGLLTVHIATSVFDSQGRRQGIIVLNLAADAIRDPIANLSIEEGVDAWILDETGVELVNVTHPELEGSNAHERVQQAGDEYLKAVSEDMLAGGRGTAIYTWPAGAGGLREQRVMAYAPVHLPGGHLWSVGTSVNYTSVIAAYSRIHRVLLFLGGTIALVVLIDMVLAMRSGYRRMIAEERARQSEELEALRETTLAIAAQLDLDKLLQSVVEQGCRLLRVEIGGLYLLDESSGDLGLAAHHGYREEYAGVRLKPGEGVAGKVLLNGEPLAVEDYRRWEGRSQQWVLGVASAVLGVPIKRGEQVIGTLIFAETGRARRFDERDIRLANLFAGEASVALENARLYNQAQHEIAERKRTEEALRESEELYRSLVETSPDAITLTDLDSRVIMMNQQAARLYGFDSVEEMLAEPRNAFDFIAPQDRQRAAENAIKTLEQGSVQNIEYTLLRRDGSAYPAELSASVVRGADGQPRAFIGVVRDISERKQAQQALELRVEQLTALSRASQAVTASLELDQVLSEIVSLASRVVAADYTSVVLVDEAGNLGQSAENLPGVPALEYRIRDEGLTRWIVRSRQAAIVDEIGEDGKMLPDLGEGAPRLVNPILVGAGVRSLAGLPLVVQDRLLGVLYLHSLRPGAFRDQLPLLTAFANQVAIAIENARLHQALQDYAHRLEQRVQERTAQLQAHYARLEAILHSVSDGIVVTDAAGDILEANSLAQNWLTRSLSPKEAAALQEAIKDLARNAPERPERVLELTGLDLELRAAPIVEPGMERAAAVVAIHDISHLKALDRMKSRFVSNVSHELRTPITTIKLYAALMHNAPPAKAHEYLEVLTQEADRQAQLVEDILQMSRIDAGRLELRPRPDSLNQLVEIAVASHRILAEERGLALECRLAQPAPVAVVDPDRIAQVLINLVSNAVRYTPKGGRVVVSTGKAEADGRTWATVTVADTGMGIPEEELPHIFERFFRGEQPRAMQIPGTGLGLAIVKEIVELHGGWVTVESQVGVGSTFTVWLPLAE